MSKPGGLVRGRRPRKLAAVIVSRLPCSALRKALYALLLGYVFGARTKIAAKVFINVHDFRCGDDVVIARENRFYGPIRVSIGAKTFVGERNQIMCGEAVEGEWAQARNYGRAFTVGAECLINEAHLFDVVGTIEIGDGTWIAGFRSQLMTHGASVTDRDIHLGPRCFLGSAVLMAPGSRIAADTIVAMGALVTRKFDESDVIIGGAPAKVLRARSSEDEHAFARTW